MLNLLRKIFSFQQVHAAPLAVFRIIFGLMMLGGTLRFAYNGWIDSLYIKPQFHFTYYGFEWVKALSANGMYIVFVLMALSALCMAIGLRYRLSAIVFFITFTYVELIDKTTYLNHYYFVSIVSFILIWLPAGKYFSVDVYLNPALKKEFIPNIAITTIQLQLGLVYFFAGVAKLNYDWLFEAMPLRIWLQPHTELPLIGYFMDKTWVAYFFSWFGAIYDLSIPFLLCYRKTRGIAYFFVIAFHVLTWLLFQIGLFPFIMILSTLVFFSTEFHQKIIAFLSRLLPKSNRIVPASKPMRKPLLNMPTQLIMALVVLHFTIQIVLPFRYVLYPGKLFWTEEGFRFSWRVMLMEKAGKTFFYVRDPQTGHQAEVVPADYLTPNQEKMMATQPDMILEFAHYIGEIYKQKGIKNPIVTADSYVTLNGSGSRRYINQNVNLANETESLRHKNWVLPFNENGEK